MCLPSRSPKTPAPDPELAKERESEKAKEQVKTSEMKLVDDHY